MRKNRHAVYSAWRFPSVDDSKNSIVILHYENDYGKILHRNRMLDHEWDSVSDCRVSVYCVAQPVEVNSFTRGVLLCLIFQEK